MDILLKIHIVNYSYTILIGITLLSFKLEIDFERHEDVS